MSITIHPVDKRGKMRRESRLEKDLADPKMSITAVLGNFHKVHEINRGRNTYGEYHHLVPLLKKYDNKFEEYMRMKQSTFDYIKSETENDLKKNWCNLHSRAIFPEEQLVLTIRFLATGMTYSDLSFTFRMGKSTICEVIKRTMEVLWKRLYPKHMPVPNKERFLEIAEEFCKIHNLPHCVGAIDVRHIWIRKPEHSGSLYWNFKHFNSIPLQGVVDGRGKYISMDIGGYGGQHDATTLRASSFYDALDRKIVQLPQASELPGSKTVVPYYFIADCAYPLMENLMKPYTGQSLTDDQKRFNYWISSTRRVVECTFGQDCQRWHIYYKQIECHPETVSLIAKSTCVLHNVIMDLEKEQKDEKGRKKNHGHEQENTEESKALAKIKRPARDEDVQDGFRIGKGREIREKLKSYFTKNQHKKRKLK